MERPLFDKYHVQKKIGVGAFSEIYLGKDPDIMPVT